METNNNNKSKIIIICIIVVIVLAIIGLGISVYMKSKNKNNTGENNITNEEEYDIEANRNFQNEIIALNATYQDGVAWLKVPGTSIDAPVFKGTTNEDYFAKDRDALDKKYGELFMDYRCNLNNMENMAHFIIYGHNPEDTTYFSDLLKYEKEDYYKNHDVIYMSTINGNYKWKIFTVYKTTPDFFYIDVNFDTVTEYATFLNSLKEKSMYNTNVDVDSNDTILTLSTCDYSVEDGRFVIQAKLVK